jgi:hypothetical protein
MTVAARPLTGSQITDALVDAARKFGYIAAHLTEARKTEPGFPDVVCVGFGRAFFWECKSRGEKLRPATVAPRSGRRLPGQREWIDAFAGLGLTVTAGVVRAEPEEDGDWSYDEALDAMLEGRG